MVQIMCFNLIASKPVLKGFPLDEHFGLQPVQLDEGRGTNRTESREWEGQEKVREITVPIEL